MKKETLSNELLDLNFDLSDVPNSESEDLMAVTFWIPKPRKEKYERIQERSKRKFGKHLKGIVIRSIDLVDEEAS